ncbi:hypothetical protein E3N88_31789 [Mikania micrantha]|uniref:Reverse transcriptase domain-containing protein n=1 Tax=Mikania micrantha TaxID=192012 RepID=A0A5N6M6N1_9ASTR|nr:hypothetical protein E3N88_31789 [Mikania micrantha]
MLLVFRRTSASVRPARFLSALAATVSPSENPTPDVAQPLTKPQLKTLVLSQYHHGKFSNLLQNVVASPSVLLTAVHSLTHSVPNSPEPPSIDSISTNFFSISDMSDELTGKRFDFDSCLIKLANKGEPISLILPNLKLKVLIESIRLVLEVIYDDRFATFSYGGRVDMGRHTAIRYLKNTVENPSWWFTVSFGNNKQFKLENLGKLCLIMEEKIEDKMLIDVIKRLIESNVVRIELGGCYLGRGFPQECGLNSILINIYLNVFDQKLQELRLLINKENVKTRLENGNDDQDHVFYKPLKIYAVRYLDEILVITSGSKGLTIKLKNLVVQFLAKKLVLEVNKEKTVIHSAVSEEISFLGMDIRAVTPSVLHPPMSEKAIRARKKYLRQKEVRLQELKNRRETNRKKLAMKLFNHVYKKLKTSNGFKLDFQIEKEVGEIFEKWARETVDEFMESVEERAAWYRKLSGGDFLSLKRIRDQLPVDLVDSYDKFQENVEKYLNPIKARKELEESKIKLEEEEEKKYTERTVKDLTKLCIKVDAPDQLVRKAVRIAGFTNNMGRPRPISSLMVLEDADIIKWHTDEDLYRCGAHFCQRFDTIVYRIRLLQKDLNLNDEKLWVLGMGVIPGVFDRKCVPLCPDHISQMYIGALTLQDVDFSSLLDV